MPSTNSIESLHISENSFVLNEDTEISYLEHFAAPFTGGDSCTIPKGTEFTLHGFMNVDTLYMHTIYDEEIDAVIKKKIEKKYPKLLKRYYGVSFYITKEQLQALPITFTSGSLTRLLDIFENNRKLEKIVNNYDWLKEFSKQASAKVKEDKEKNTPKHIDYKPDSCPTCGSKCFRPVYWGEITKDVQKLKSEHKIYIGEELYGTEDKDYSQKYRYSFVQAPMAHVDFACGECGASFIQDNK